MSTDDTAALVQHAAIDAAEARARESWPLATGIERIVAERQRQIDVEKWSIDHDREHHSDELAMAAVCYALPPGVRGDGEPEWWPWASTWWKPGDRIRELEKAGALIAAEIDRLLGEQP